MLTRLVTVVETSIHAALAAPSGNAVPRVVVPPFTPTAPPERNYFPLILLGVGVVAVIVVAYLIGNAISRASSKHTSRRLETLLQKESSSPEQILASMVADPAWFLPIAQQAPGERIVAIVEAYPKVEESAVGAAAGLAAGLVGAVVGFQLVDKDVGRYLCLTDRALHFMTFDEGRCVESLSFTRPEIADTRIVEHATPYVSDKKYRLTSYEHELHFTARGRQWTFYFTDAISRSPMKRPGVVSLVPTAERVRLYAVARGFKQAMRT